MLDIFLFAGLPYIAIFVLIAGSIIRYRSNQFSYSALSSQFLESKTLLWGSVPWHIGIFIVLAGHLIAFLAPGLWKNLTSNYTFLLTVETIGVLASVLCIAGLLVLLARRALSDKLQKVTTVMDVLIVVLFLMQVIGGLALANQHRWGAAWSTATTTPYLWSVLTLRPDISYVAEMPALIKFHIVTAWIIFLLVPFSRLIHIFSLPVRFIFRPPQKVVWNTSRRFEREISHETVQTTRRHFVKSMIGMSAATLLLSVGVFDKLINFFRKPDMSLEEESKLLSEKLERLKLTTEERTYQLERMRNPYIYVAHLNQLSKNDGKYFIDYQMRPALAFLSNEGLPILISAKCTHLGCTVGNKTDNQNRILCPCHVSYFNIVTGKPNEGAPAKLPLPHLGWVLMNAQNEAVMSQNPLGKREGTWDAAKAGGYRVFIAKKFEEMMA